MPAVPAALVAASLLVTSLGAVPDPCQLVTAAEVSSALGSAPSRGKPMGPSLDEETGAKMWVCSLAVGKMMLSIALAEFATPAAAGKALTTMASQDPDDEEIAKMTEQAGLGDRAIWGAMSSGAIWVALEDKYLLNLTLTGDIGDGVRYRELLKRLASLALAKL